MTREEAITYFEGQKKRLEDFRKIYPSPDTVGYQATTKEISFYDMSISALSTEGEYIKKSELLQHVTTEELSDFKDCDVIHAEEIDELTTYSFPDSAEGEYIKKEEFKSAIHNYFIGLNHNVTEEDIQVYIDALALYSFPDREKGEWIPVSERLPEEGKNVLFCDIDNDIMLGYHLTYAPATHFVEKGSWEDMKNVSAWMELPEPYKAEKGGEEV